MNDQQKIDITTHLLNKNEINTTFTIIKTNENILKFKIKFNNSGVEIFCKRQGKHYKLKIIHKEWKNSITIIIDEESFKNEYRIEKQLKFFSSYNCFYNYKSGCHFFKKVFKENFNKEFLIEKKILIDFIITKENIKKLPIGLQKYKTKELKKKFVKLGNSFLKKIKPIK